MSGFVTIEVCNDGTITRACARVINAHLRKLFAEVEPVSGATNAQDLMRALERDGVAFRVVDAASLTGADKARHTRAVNHSHKAQVRRGERAIVAALECEDEATAKLLVEYAGKRVAA